MNDFVEETQPLLRKDHQQCLIVCNCLNCVCNHSSPSAPDNSDKDLFLKFKNKNDIQRIVDKLYIHVPYIRCISKTTGGEFITLHCTENVQSRRQQIRDILSDVAVTVLDIGDIIDSQGGSTRQSPRGRSPPTRQRVKSLSAPEIDASNQNERSHLSTTTLMLAGLSCERCVKALDEVFKLQKDITTRVQVSLHPVQKAVIEHGLDLSIPALIRKIDEGLGFQVLDFKTSHSTLQVLVESPAPALLSKTTIHIHGMTCSSCVKSLESAYKSLHAFKAPQSSISVSLLPERVTATYNPNLISEEDVVKVASDAGFSVILATTENLNDKATTEGITAITHDPSRIGHRDLIEKIGDIGFEATLFTPDANLIIEKREASALASIKLATITSFIFAIPFLFMMVVMMALPESHSLRIWLMGHVLLRGLSREDLAGFLLSTPVQFGLGFRFYRGAYRSLVYAGSANMDVLVSLGTSASYSYSIYSLITSILDTRSIQTATFWETSVLLIFFLNAGKYMETIAKQSTTTSIKKLASLVPPTTTIVTLDSDSGLETAQQLVDTQLVQVGDVVKIFAGGRVTIDGIIVRGSTWCDESMLSGEAAPVEKEVGDRVVGGSVNQTSTILVKALQVGSQTSIARISKMVQDAQTLKAPIQSLVDSISAVFVPLVLLTSLLTLCVWMVICDWIYPRITPSPFEFSLNFAVCVLVVACPCALGLAIPTAIVVGTGIAARFGILVKGGGAVFQNAWRVTAIAFDKTGTLTVGKPQVTNELFLENAGIDSVTAFWAFVSVCEANSGHPLAKSIREHALVKLANTGSSATPVLSGSVSEYPGKGIKGTFEVPGDITRYAEIYIGTRAFIVANNCHDEGWVDAVATNWQKDAKTVVYVAHKLVENKRNSATAMKKQNGLVIGIIALSDIIRADSFLVIDWLKKRGIEVYMLTGDNAETGKSVGQILGIKPENILSQVLPEDKKSMIARLQATDASNRRSSLLMSQMYGIGGRKRQSVVAMVGDGINDAPALAQSDIGIAIGAGSDIAAESAHAILIRSNLVDVITLLDISRVTFSRVRTNLFCAFVYNIVGIPLAAGAFWKFGLILSPWFAGLAMALSSVSVLGSSLLLRLYKPPKISKYREDGEVDE